MDDEIELDDDLAAQMGFSSFGGKPKNKRRKIATGANDHPVSTTPAQQSTGINQLDVSKPGFLPAAAPTINKPSYAVNTNTDAPREPDLRAYRNGVRNERGDMAYFMPSFIEDPWRHLQKDHNT